MSVDEGGDCVVRHLPSQRYLRSFSILKIIEKRKDETRQSSPIIEFTVKKVLVSNHGYFTFWLCLDQVEYISTFSCNGELIGHKKCPCSLRFV